jgi:hypothetical protein
MCAGVEFFVVLFLFQFADDEYIQKLFEWIFKDT